MTQIPRSAMVYVLNKFGQNMLQKETLLEIQVLDELIKNITVVVDGRVINYSNICGIVNEKCFENPILNLMPEMDKLISRKRKVKFPVEIDPLTYKTQYWIINFGGVKYDTRGYVRNVKAMRLIYPLDESNSSKEQWLQEWRKAFLKNVKQFKFNFIELYPCPVLSTELDMKSIADDTLFLISVAIIVAALFCVVTYTTNSWVMSKPWMGIAAVFSAGLAIVSSFGLMSSCGVETISYNISLPFLILAIEIDDSFVIVANWRVTEVQDNVEERMGKTYSKSSVSITITTLTNILSFCIAMTAEFPGVRIFCYYATTCVCFTYFYQITFFGSCLALSGYREERCLNAFTFKMLKEKSEKYTTHHNHEYLTMKFFRDNVARFISHPTIKIIIIFIYFCNLAIGIWGVTFLKEGLNIFTLYPNHSKVTKGYRIYSDYFTEFSFSVHIVINKTLDYSQEKVQKSIENMMMKFHSHPNIIPSEFDISWLKYYEKFQNHPVSPFTMNGYDVSRKQDFIDGLRNVFLRIGEAKQFSNDIVFNDNYTEIICSRFFVGAKHDHLRGTERKLINEMWKIAEEFEFPVIIHSFYSSAIEQALIIKRITIQLFWLTALLIFIVFFAFIPNFLCALLVGLSITSIIVETFGYMSFWNVNLDVITMMIIIVCNGFCVNYPTHMCYVFLTSSHSTVEEKLKESLYHVGFPILQGSLSTILVSVIFLYNNMYVYVSFVKIVVFISLQTLFHSIFVIPVFLSIIVNLFQKNNSNTL
ncbi:patched domain-containing protein 3-like [Centruroides sculpturatus]|uniref:patched domain-containing protein 3-like n=1 Tax=Centruroides sculpturatus TaxID=218467 RepID=UPI000C6D11F8|nr:patched domain-containing protein 3-like [Centruroides sculpturatus]